jgi:hypothetical protein
MVKAKGKGQKAKGKSEDDFYASRRLSFLPFAF